MNIPINPEHVRKRRQKYGPDGDFITMPAPRPETTAAEASSASQAVIACREDDTAVVSDPARELVRAWVVPYAA